MKSKAPEMNNIQLNDADPFQFNLQLSIQNKGLIKNGNPYCTNKDFLSKLLQHFENDHNFEACAEILNCLKSAN